MKRNQLEGFREHGGEVGNIRTSLRYTTEHGLVNEVRREKDLVGVA